MQRVRRTGVCGALRRRPFLFRPKVSEPSMSLLLPELLCPAGDEAALRAAVDSGANAVYLGYRVFGARASATNFDAEALEAAVRYAHLYHVRVYVTVNTLVKPGEIAGPARQRLRDCRHRRGCGDCAGPGRGCHGAAGISRTCPACLNANGNLQTLRGARLARSLGFSRVVLARECSLEDAHAVAETGIETEVFCAWRAVYRRERPLPDEQHVRRTQRQPGTLRPALPSGASRMDGMQGPLLSLRDLCLLDDLPVLCASGVRSLKVEGAPQKPRICGRGHFGLPQGAGCRRGRAISARTRCSASSFYRFSNRGGFTRGHILGAEDADLVTPDRVSHEGLPLGKVLAVRGHLAALHMDRALHDGDSLQLRGAGESYDLRYSGPDIPAGGHGFPASAASMRKQSPACRSPAWRMPSSWSGLAHMRPRPIPVSMAARFAQGQPMTLTLTDGEVSVTVTGPVVDAAKSRPLTEVDARRQLDKLGGTPFVLEEESRLQVMVDEGIFLPVSALNALRREAVERLIRTRTGGVCLPPDGLSVTTHCPQPTCARSRISPSGLDTLAVIFYGPGACGGTRAGGSHASVLCAPHVHTEKRSRGICRACRAARGCACPRR